MSGAELCARNYRRLISWVLDAIKRPISTEFRCFGDEVYLVCVGDWIYVMDRREGTLKAANDAFTLLMALRNYAPDIIKVATPEAKQSISQALSKNNNPLMVYYARAPGSLYIGGTIVEFDSVLILSDTPCTVYLIKNNSLVGRVDFSTCSDFDKSCQSAKQLLWPIVEDAVKQFDSALAT